MARAVNRREDSDNEDLDEARAVPLAVLGSTAVIIDGRTFHVGKVSLNQLAAIARLALVALKNMNQRQREELRRIAQETGKAQGQATMGNVEAILALLEEDTLQRAVGIVLHAEADWVNEHVGPADLLDIIDALVENNDIQKVMAGFLRLSARFQSLQGTTSAKPS